MPTKEAIRQTIVKICFIIFWLIICDGALRKWFLPMLAKPIALAKDPILLYCYWLAFKGGFWNMNSWGLRIALVICVIFSLLPLIQIPAVQLSPFLAVFAIRQYVLYIPLCFLLPSVFQGRDLLKLVNYTSFAGLVNGAIVLLQYKLPPTHFLNKSVEAEATIFTYGTDNLVRTTGTFSFTFQHQLFCALFAATTVTLFMLNPKDRPLKGWLYLSTLAACIINILLDGNRGVFLLIANAALFAVAAAMGARRPALALKRLGGLALGVALCGIIYLSIFSSAYENMKARFEGSYSSEGSPAERIIGTYYLAWNEMTHITPLGEGLCTGSNAAQTMMVKRTFQKESYENELPRVIQEAGVFGLLYLGFRQLLALYIVVEGWFAFRRSGNPLPFMLSSFIMSTLPSTLMTSNLNIAPMIWFFTGIALAACRLGKTDVGHGSGQQ